MMVTRSEGWGEGGFQGHAIEKKSHYCLKKVSRICLEKMSRNQNGNVTQSNRKCHRIEKCHAIKSEMSQCWMEFLAAHEDGEVKVNQEHFIRIPF